ncbi:MAG: carbon storage regulator [Pseudomonadota bacterium]
MLILLLKPGQSVTIGNDIEIKVLSVTDKKVRVGCIADKEVPFLRSNAVVRVPKEKV